MLFSSCNIIHCYHKQHVFSMFCFTPSLSPYLSLPYLPTFPTFPPPSPPPRLISELETLVAILAADRNLLAPFYQELRDRLWVRDTKEVMTIEDTSHIASGSFLVRGKRQVSECTTKEDKGFIFSLSCSGIDVVSQPCTHSFPLAHRRKLNVHVG